MLSAVAARKARLQEKGETSTPSTPTSFNSSSTNANSEGKTLASSKRKHSPGESAKLVKRKRKGPPRVLEAKQTRYFEKIPDTILLTDSDREEQGSDVETSSESSDDVPLEPSSSRRMWSPSRPVMGAPGVISDHNAIGRNSTNTPSGSSGPFSIPLRLSTYEPTLNENFYSLTEEETITLLGPTSARDGTSCVLILLSASEKVALFGTYTLVLLRGRVSLAGVSMKASKTPHTVFSNRSSPIPIIECVASDETHSDSSDIPPRCLSAVDSHGVVMLVHRLHSGIEGLGLVCRTFENAFVPPKWSTTETLTEGIHLIKTQSDGVHPFVLPESWSKSLSSIPSPSEDTAIYGRQVFLVRGAKKSGKSTFSRTLLNRLLTYYQTVAFLECDVGQSEFTPGGMISLNLVSNHVFGSPFSHPSIPYRSHYIGSTTPKNSPSQYIEAIHSLIHTYNLDIQHGDLSQNEEPSDDIRVSDIIPLVINTMGWTKGFGANLAKQVEEIVEPSYIFDFQSQDSQTTDYFDPLHAVRPDSRDTPAQHLLEAILPSSISRQYTPADLRSLSVLSYFHAHFSSKYLSTPLFNTYATSWDTSLPLCAQPPYEVIANVKTLDLVILIGPDADDVVPSEMHRVLNGAVVGLVSNDPGTLDLPSEIESLGIDSDGIPYIQGATPPSPTTSTCLGLALIRSVSVAQDPSQDSVLHLLTPIPPAYLATKQPRVLVKGDLEIPVWGMLDYREGSDGGALGYERDRVPYLRWGKGEGLGGERRRVRRNLMRKGQQ